VRQPGSLVDVAVVVVSLRLVWLQPMPSELLHTVGWCLLFEDADQNTCIELSQNFKIYLMDLLLQIGHKLLQQGSTAIRPEMRS